MIIDFVLQISGGLIKLSTLSEFYSGSKSYLPHLDSGEICGNSVGDLGSSVCPRQ